MRWRKIRWPGSRCPTTRISPWSEALLPLAPRLVVLGGGGYNPFAVGRCWAGIWATLNRTADPAGPAASGRSRVARPALRSCRRPQPAGRTGSPRCATRHGPDRSAMGCAVWPNVPCWRYWTHESPPFSAAGFRHRRPGCLGLVRPCPGWVSRSPGPSRPCRPKSSSSSPATASGTNSTWRWPRTPEEQEIGLMFRPTVAPDGGMLFDWGAPRESQMWMTNTIAPLDMVFINADGTIRSIAEEHRAAQPGGDRQPRPGARDAGTGGRHHRAPGHPGRRPGRGADLREGRLSLGPVDLAPKRQAP